MSQTTSNSSPIGAKDTSSAAVVGTGGTGGAELPQKYKPSEHEDRMWDKWIAAKSFHAEPQRVLDGTADPYCIFIPPPNVTAALHLGHALNNTIQDILIRAKRMQGFETLWMAGTDHAGIATQAVVEKRVMKEEKKRRTDFSREDFVAKIQAFKDEYEATITNQLKKMGCSCDWDRQRFTMDEQCAAAVREAFFILFRDGLIYRGKRLVNWDPVLQTAVADDECYDEEIDGNFYYLRYPLVHAALGTPPLRGGSGGAADKSKATANPNSPGSESRGTHFNPVTWDELVARGYPGAETHPSDQQAWLTVATTRPETYLGDTAVAINPHDPRAKALRGMFAELPLVGRVIPIIEDSYVVLPERFSKQDGGVGFSPAPRHNSKEGGGPEAHPTGPSHPTGTTDDSKAKMSTGFLKVTPAHDPNDYEIGQRHKLPMVNIFSPDGRISDKHGFSDVGDAHLLVGLPREKARTKVVEEFKARDLFEGSKPTRHSVKHSDRSKAIIEPYLSDQWYVKVTDPRMAKAANEVLKKGGGPEAHPTARTTGGVGLRPAHTSFAPERDPVTKSLNTYQRNLPHWQVGGSTYFITFRVSQGQLNTNERGITMNACRHWDGKRLELHAAVIMPDHVHLLVSPFLKEDGSWHRLEELLHSIKSFSAHEINKLRGTSGEVWQPESFDRIVRDADEFTEKLNYIMQNPVRKELAAKWNEYPHTWIGEGAKSGQLRFASLVKGTGVGGKAMGGRPETHPTTSNTCNTGGVGLRPAPSSSSPPLQFFPERYAKSYEHWHDNIRDWCISRQLWWGHRIPVWSCTVKLTKQNFGTTICERTDDLLACYEKRHEVVVRLVNQKSGEHFDLPIRQAHEDRYSTPTWLTSECEGEFKLFVCGVDTTWLTEQLDMKEYFGDQALTQDPDVLDTWFSSALWPLSTLGWPDPTKFNPALNKGLLEAFNPSQTLCTAREIITLWVSRMVMFNGYLRGSPPGTPTLRVGSGGAADESNAIGSSPHAERGGTQSVPFHHVFIHAVIQDGEGRKMSKSLGNGVDPLDIIATHGADAMRFTLCHMATNTQDVRLPVKKDANGNNTSEKFDLGRNFATKLWNAARFALSMIGTPSLRDGNGGAADNAIASGSSPHTERAGTQIDTQTGTRLLDRWMLSRLAAGSAAANAALENYEFHEYAQALYDLLWRDFCDWYLEGVKPTIASNAAQQAVLGNVLSAIVRMLHPVMPYVTETLWEHMGKLSLPAVTGVTLTHSKTDALNMKREATGLLVHQAWPSFASSLRDEATEKQFDRLRALVTAIRDVRASHQVKPSARIALQVPKQLSDFVMNDDIKPLLMTFAGLESVSQREGAKPEGVSFTFESVEFFIPGIGSSKETESARVAKQVAELDKSVTTLEGRLNNPGYADRAPPHMVQQTRDELTKKRQELEAAKAALAKLS